MTLIIDSIEANQTGDFHVTLVETDTFTNKSATYRVSIHSKTNAQPVTAA